MENTGRLKIGQIDNKLIVLSVVFILVGAAGIGEWVTGPVEQVPPAGYSSKGGHHARCGLRRSRLECLDQ